MTTVPSGAGPARPHVDPVPVEARPIQGRRAGVRHPHGGQRRGLRDHRRRAARRLRAWSAARFLVEPAIQLAGPAVPGDPRSGFRRDGPVLHLRVGDHRSDVCGATCSVFGSSTAGASGCVGAWRRCALPSAWCCPSGCSGRPSAAPTGRCRTPCSGRTSSTTGPRASTGRGLSVPDLGSGAWDQALMGWPRSRLRARCCTGSARPA